ncbi:Endo-1,4-beta-xylanase A precursor [Paenibacillus konkukensis]|uniref:Endo-1,4-beta-xylanase A n=1 Tax=Paenibacillus konkukensis TaxID=2020716 RepID=A0ABY4RQU0_9BACL|nr:S-layer homology domain-containing protein [Paenibacillus konkukensis]UQZ84347.1 Endo-1,4-beta-xylanase A precursor [Paenibacillus konkukensis]
MTMKKKLVVSTVAASLVFSSLAGLPVSTKGLLEKLGVGAEVAQAATPGLNTIVNELNKVHSYVWTDDEKASISQARAQLNNLGNNAEDTALVSEVTTRINSKLSAVEDPSEFDQLSDANILKLFSALNVFFTVEAIEENTEEGTSLADALVSKELRPVIKQLAKLGGSSKEDLSVQDAADFAIAVEAALKAQLADKDFDNLAKLATDVQAMKDIIKAAVDSVMNNKALKFSTVLSNIGITVDDVAAVTNKIVAAVDPKREAATTIALALLRSEANTTFARTSDYIENSQTQNYQFTILGKTLPNILVWTSSNANIAVAYVEDSGKIKTTQTGTGSVTTTLEGKIVAPGTLLDNKVLVRQTVTSAYNPVKNNNNKGGGGGGGGGIVTSPVNQASNNAQSTLSSIKDQLKNASEEKRQQLIEQARAAVAETIAQITQIDLSSSIAANGDKGVAKLDTAALVQQIQEIAAESQKLFDALKEIDPDAAPSKLELTLNLGDITVKTLEIPLAKELLAAAKDNGIDKIAVSIKGVTLALDPRTFSADTTLTIGKKDADAATSVTQLPVASGVFEFEFSSNGAAVTNFSSPVEVRLAVADPSKFDTEKLVLAKIVDGKLEFYGGKYNAKDRQFNGKRKSFSTYTVVENNVVFNDTASVKAWAGRQIEVAAAKGILEGRGDNEFVPNGTVTRAEFAKMIVKTFGLEDASATENFSDVNDNDWFKPYVAAAVKSGLVNGREEGKFDPNGQITRAEMATIAARALQSVNGAKAASDVDAALKAFTDADSIHESLKAGVALSVGEGIIVGEDNNKFNPNADSTRAQAAVVIYRLLNK